MTPFQDIFLVKHHIPSQHLLFCKYTNFRSFSRFLGQKFDSEIMLEKPQISRIFKAFLNVVSGTKIKLKSRENDRKWVYTQTVLPMFGCFAGLRVLPSPKEAFKDSQALHK